MLKSAEQQGRGRVGSVMKEGAKGVHRNAERAILASSAFDRRDFYEHPSSMTG